MKYCILILLSLCCIACTSKVSKEQITNLNGYWEITEVSFANGQKKEYTISTSIDYIKIKEMQGFKKKVSPTLNGSYIVSDAVENFTIIEKDETYYFSYKNDLSQWQELIKNIEKDSFTIINEENITYTYKRYTPINIE